MYCELRVDWAARRRAPWLTYKDFLCLISPWIIDVKVESPSFFTHTGTAPNIDLADHNAFATSYKWTEAVEEIGHDFEKALAPGFSCTVVTKSLALWARKDAPWLPDGDVLVPYVLGRVQRKILALLAVRMLFNVERLHSFGFVFNDGLGGLSPIRARIQFAEALNAEIMSNKSIVEDIKLAKGPLQGDASTQTLAWATTLSMKVPRDTTKVLDIDRAEEKDVFIERKEYGASIANYKTFSITLRPDTLTRFLQRFSQTKKPQILHCLEYIEDPERARFGFIFQISSPRVSIIESYPKPPLLEHRIAIATRITSTLSAFHCVGDFMRN
ncbi:uncharacterized protein BDR25DRAFT_354358 [Lindgomyces ingoldianus]|uniref:Uncharacterized protein n=1 Tax=Lindgomyces ingoldianus TaxID=673940 RepID=A0ACB6QXY0_9PLEO|nr:uncharacterized protein BDR25DRAFT_354358 [Lindgomyces ingoldianus]KAF2471853.1 hypothetical protein BDR25DRAFT_354358 [Lindgomyces ingoldianus]